MQNGYISARYPMRIGPTAGSESMLEEDRWKRTKSDL